LRGLPAEVADGRGGVGDALEGADLLVGGELAFDLALVGLDAERGGLVVDLNLGQLGLGEGGGVGERREECAGEKGRREGFCWGR
jgi:hypothetical protein